MKRFEFNNQLKRGQMLEKIIINYLRDTNPEDSIEDVSNDKYYQNIDVDVIYDNGSSREMIEIKSDETTYKDCNLFVEINSCKRINSPGWLYKTESDYIIYSFTKRGFYYKIPTQILKDLISICDFKKKEAYDTYKTSIGCIIPAYILDEYKVESEELDKRYRKFYGDEKI